MKTLMVIVIVILGFNVYSLCISSVPDAVKNAFAKKFPVKNDVAWSKQDSARYEAQFSVHGIDTQAYFTSNGKWLETQTEIALSQLPQKVVQTITKNYPGCSIIEAEKIEDAKNGIFYQADIMSPKTKKELELKDDGSLYKQ
jgi:hypothetical protein